MLGSPLLYLNFELRLGDANQNGWGFKKERIMQNMKACINFRISRPELVAWHISE